MTSEVPPKKRWGCLKLTCGGFFCLIVLSVFAAHVLWNSLKNWDSGLTAWEHLPPQTLAAVEAHDINGLLNHLLRDPGAMSVLDGFATRLDRIDASFIGAEYHTLGDFSRSFREMYGEMGFAHTAVAPNIATLGVLEAPASPFLIFRPPTWMRWFSKDTHDRSVEKMEQEHLYTAWIDGWVVVSTAPEAVQVVVDSWDEKSAPLGGFTGTDEPHLLFAYRETALEGNQGENKPAAEGGFGGLMHADPFAGNAPPEEEGKDYFAFRAALLPTQGGWSIAGQAGIEGVLTEEFFDERGQAEDWLTPSARADVEAVFKPSSTDLAKLRNALATRAEKGTATENHPRERLLWLWLWDSWLERTTGSLVIQGAPPPQPGRSGAPRLPLFSLGWTYPPGVDQRAAADAFTQSLSLFLDATTSPGGNALDQALRQSIGYSLTDEASGSGGVVSLPKVLAAGAQPAWRFPRQSTQAAGWLATDPAGVDRGGMQTAAAILDEYPENGFACLRWQASDEFRTPLFDVARERLKLIPESQWPEKARILRYCDIINNILGAYPAGAAAARGDRTRIVFRAAIPFGNVYRWEVAE